VLPFRIDLQPGVPISEQIVYAATRAIVSGGLAPGDAFPSVRTLSREAHINPNTAAKVITALLNDGLLESRPGVGTVVAAQQTSTHRARKQLLGPQAETLVVEAKRLNIPLQDLQTALEDHWIRLTPPDPKGDASE